MHRLGTSGLRACRLGPNGNGIAQREAALGVMRAATANFAGALKGVMGDWLTEKDTPIVMSGMIDAR